MLITYLGRDRSGVIVGNGVNVSFEAEVATGALACVGSDVSVERVGELVGAAGEEQEIKSAISKKEKVKRTMYFWSWWNMGSILTDIRVRLSDENYSVSLTEKPAIMFLFIRSLLAGKYLPI